MKQNKNKVFNYSLIVICIITIILGLFYLYQYLNKSIEHFAITNFASTLNQNYYNGEPFIKIINNAGTVDIDIQNVTKTTPCEYISSNNIGLYGTDNKNLYYFNKTDNKWYITPIKSILPTITNPDFNNTKTNCRFKTYLFSSKSTLWYYYDTLNEIVNVDCLYYVNLDSNGIPSINTTTKIVDLNCLRLPLINNSSTTTTTTPATTQSSTTYSDKPYLTFDRLRLFTANDNVLFAVGCEPLNVPTTIYYCKLNNGKPTSTEASIWKTIDIPFDRKNIKNILINDTCVFIYYNELNTNNIIVNKIYYNVIEFNSDNTLKTNWIEWTMTLTDSNTPFYDKGNTYNMYINNDIVYIYDAYINKLWWHCLENNKPITKDNYKWYMLKFNNTQNILDLTIYNNNLIGYNNVQNSKFYVIKLYNKTAVPTTTSTTTTNPTSLIVTMLLTLFNMLIPLTISSSISSPAVTPVTTSFVSGTPTTTSTGSSATSSGTPTTTSTGSSATSSGTPTTTSTGSGTPTTTYTSSGTTTTKYTGSGTPTTTYKSSGTTILENIKDKLGVGMVLDGSNNVGNLNDFMSKNSILGNNLYISPMNNNGFIPENEDNVFSTTSTNTKNIESYFYPMIHLE